MLDNSLHHEVLHSLCIDFEDHLSCSYSYGISFHLLVFCKYCIFSYHTLIWSIQRESNPQPQFGRL
ncbi:unknown [Salmonella phage FelixO1]|uniref:Uncharacterized protein n=1 Tax=Salmonella phage Felix O1 (isolate Felix O1-VT1) TaxID=1283336 RepID=Q6KGK9_BPFO1|nr:unknown [Salmonella phage FelixO1]